MPMPIPMIRTISTDAERADRGLAALPYRGTNHDKKKSDQESRDHVDII
jgi:hypothetical protein